MTELSLREKFLETLSQIFGERDLITSRFGSTSLGQIAERLSLSSSLFTKLLSGTATEGMYIRAIKNLERIKTENNLRNELEAVAKQMETQNKTSPKKYFLSGLILSSAVLGLLYFLQLNYIDKEIEQKAFDSKNLFTTFFDPDFSIPHVLPYVNNLQVQNFCPCSAFEGTWQLSKPYAIPTPYKKPGLFYVAKESELKLKCSRVEDQELSGKVMHGFEVLKHELWKDSQNESLVPKYFDPKTKNFTKEYYNLNFAEDGRFIKVAEFTSLFYNKVTIDNGNIIRKGEPSGRYASYINKEAAREHEIDVNEVLNHIVGTMTKTKCGEIKNPFCNPNTLVEGESELNFQCDFSIITENLGIGGTYPYNKTYKFIKQHYSDNLLCSCDDDS